MAAVASPDRLNYVLALAVDADFYRRTNPGLGLADRLFQARPYGHPGRRHHAVAVRASAIPSASSQRSASMAARQPSPAAVTAWR